MLHCERIIIFFLFSNCVFYVFAINPLTPISVNILPAVLIFLNEFYFNFITFLLNIKLIAFYIIYVWVVNDLSGLCLIKKGFSQ